MRYSYLLLDILMQNPFLGIPKIATQQGHSHEYFQHANMIVNLYYWQHFLGIVDYPWLYTPLRAHANISNLPDAIIYNTSTGDCISIQYKYKLNQIYSYNDLKKLHHNYNNTDLLILGLHNSLLYNKQLVINSSIDYNNIIFQNYEYCKYEAIDPNVTIGIFTWYNNNIQMLTYEHLNNAFYSDLQNYHYNKPLSISADKEKFINMIKTNHLDFNHSLVRPLEYSILKE